jgi:hypothetical protein
VVEHRGQLQQFGHRADAPRHFIRRPPGRLQPIGEVLAHRHMGEDRVVLEHEAHTTLAHRHARHVAPTEQDAAFARLLHPRDHVHRGGLAAAGRAEEGNKLAVRNRQVHGFQRGEGAEAFHQIFKADRAHALAIRFKAQTQTTDSTIRMARATAAT